MKSFEILEVIPLSADELLPIPRASFFLFLASSSFFFLSRSLYNLSCFDKIESDILILQNLFTNYKEYQ